MALTYVPRGLLRSTQSALSPGSWVAARLALARSRRDRVERIVAVTQDRARQRRRPTRETIRELSVGRGAQLTWQQRPAPPEPGPRGAVVTPIAMATCDMDRPLGLGATPFPLPLPLGHECVAEVVAVGSEVRGVAPGDRVVVPFQISCGTCPACRLGLTGSCTTVPPLSMYGFGVIGGLWGGAIADQLSVPYADAMLVPLPPGVSPAAAASAGDTLTDAYRHIAPHVDRVRDHPDGASITIVGAWSPRSAFSASMPLYAGLVARALVPEASVLVIDARVDVRDQAEGLGLAAGEPHALRTQRSALVVDSSASPRGLGAALAATAPDGFCSCAGTFHAQVKIPASLMFGRNVTLSISRSHVRTDLPAVLSLMAAGLLQPELVTTTVAPYDDAPDALRHHLLTLDTKTVLVRDEAGARTPLVINPPHPGSSHLARRISWVQ